MFLLKKTNKIALSTSDNKRTESFYFIEACAYGTSKILYQNKKKRLNVIIQENNKKGLTLMVLENKQLKSLI